MQFKKIKRVLLIVLLATSQISFAQLSTRTSLDPSNFRLGTRPTEGNYGIFIGPSFSEVEAMIDSETNWRGLPYLNFKYYKTDNVVYRIGVQIYSLSEKSSGSETVGEETYDFKSGSKESFFKLTPGIEYHFDSKNLLDVYVGAYMPIGYDHYSTETLEMGNRHTVSQTPFVIGLGGFIGLQCFVADLPFAIGLEYGLSYYGRFGMQYKHTVENDGKEQIYYTESSDNYSNSLEDLSTKKSVFGGDFRLTFTYFFK